MAYRIFVQEGNFIPIDGVIEGLKRKNIKVIEINQDYL